MKLNKKYIVVIAILLAAGVNYLTANTKPMTKEEVEKNKAQFIEWLKAYDGVRADEKEVAIGMMAENFDDAKKHFSKACEQGNDSGCFQMALIDMAETNSLDKLYNLAQTAQSKVVGKRSALFMGAYVLDHTSKEEKDNKDVQRSIDILSPRAADNDADSQFILSHLYLLKGYSDQADDMLNKACNNPQATEKIKKYCMESSNTSAFDQSGNMVDKSPSQAGGGGCPTCQQH
ncbi:MAG: hypothetical protein PHE67_00685 [Campylobacterales bacterium]|nr:hypothetical protein [Campylobacterales bacterium]